MTVSFNHWTEGAAGSSIQTIPVKAAPKSLPLEPVSSRLLRTLVHPSKEPGSISQIHFFPDGKKIIAGHYPGGIAQVWDVESGSQLLHIEMAKGLRRGSGNIYEISPDWKRLYSSKDKQQLESIEKDGKKLTRWTFDGDLRTWNLETGQLLERWQHSPPHNINVSMLLPGGKTFYLMEEPPGDFVGRPPRTASLLDIVSKERRPFPSGYSMPSFSKDGKLFVADKTDEKGYALELTLFETSTLKALTSIPFKEPLSWCDSPTLSPDGKLIIGTHRIFSAKNNYSSWKAWLKIWDSRTGDMLLSQALVDGSAAGYRCFSQDGTKCIVTTWRDPMPKLFVIDLIQHQLLHTIPIPQYANNPKYEYGMREPIFSPDMRWLAIANQAYIKVNPGETPPVEEVPQARIHLFEVATMELKHTIITPPGGYSGVVCFSPDGKLLASGAQNRVLLWDMSNPAGLK